MFSKEKNIGHYTAHKKCQQMLATKKFPHALLITGDTDIGKYRFARYIAEMMYIDSPLVQRDIQRNMCSAVATMGDLWQVGRLENWERIAKTSYFDQRHRTGKDGESPRKTDVIGVRDIHSFLKPLFQTSPLAYKIGIIRDVDRMTTEAQNAFLKTLEEPPSQTFFLLTTRHPRSVQETVRSRCQHMSLGLHSDEVLFSFLETYFPSFTESELLVMMAQGRSEYLFRCLEDSDFFLQQKQDIQDISRLFFAPNSHKIAKAHALSAPEKKKECDMFLQNCTRFLRSVLSEKGKGKSLDIAQSISYSQILHLQKAKTYLDRGRAANGNIKMLLENFFLSFSSEKRENKI